MNETTQRKNRLVPYETIVAASEGDIEAIGAVLDHYTGYITKHYLQEYYLMNMEIHTLV
ncbi:helix-turn-helix domain-containing protein [Listeria monocytogenes]|nr:helix-turn-helix domain-containing protein [Listeria monocytogenes]